MYGEEFYDIEGIYLLRVLRTASIYLFVFTSARLGSCSCDPSFRVIYICICSKKVTKNICVMILCHKFYFYFTFTFYDLVSCYPW